MNNRQTQTDGLTCDNEKELDRRCFLRTSAAAGAGLVLPSAAFVQSVGNKPDDVNVALLGAGKQGRTLMMDCLKIPGVRFKAVCDIWSFYQNYASNRLKKITRYEPNTYVDYKEMLDKEKDLDAVIIATPDFWHADHTVDCLKAGLNVYCEKEMSNTLAGAKKMVQAAKETGKLLQIGHQRRSNPRYIFCYEKLIKEAKLLGKIAAVNGQWNRAVRIDEGAPKGAQIDAETLAKYGYKSMEQLRNWRWYKKLGGGPIVDLGSHQIDIYNWFLEAHPKSVMASGRTNYYDKKTHEWYDTVMAVYEYDTKQGAVTAFYQTVSSSGSGGYFETFMGDKGVLTISESSNRCDVYRDKNNAPEWDKWVKKGYLYEQCKCEKDCIEEAVKKCVEKCGCKQIKEKDTDEIVDVRESVPPPRYDLPVAMNKKYHQPHLENFFDAIRSGGKVKLNCPAEVGYETAVAVLKVNEAAEAGRKLNFKPEEFKV